MKPLPLLWVLDGTSILLRAWFAGAPGTAPGGQPCGAARAFARSVARFSRVHEIVHGVVLFDVSLDTFRRELDPRYKAHRPAPPLSLRWELERAEELARALGFGVFASPRFEADDLAATFARQARRVGCGVRILAEDKDLFQLVRDEEPSVAVVSLRTGESVDAQGVIRRLGVAPAQVVDFQSLVGDATDGVEGVKGIGARTAAALLSVAPLDVLLQRPELAATAPVRGARRMPMRLEGGAATISLARSLVRLRDDVPLETAVRLDTPVPLDLVKDTARTPPDADAPVWSRIGMRMPA